MKKDTQTGTTQVWRLQKDELFKGTGNTIHFQSTQHQSSLNINVVTGCTVCAAAVNSLPAWTSVRTSKNQLKTERIAEVRFRVGQRPGWRVNNNCLWFSIILWDILCKSRKSFALLLWHGVGWIPSLLSSKAFICFLRRPIRSSSRGPKSFIWNATEALLGNPQDQTVPATFKNLNSKTATVHAHAVHTKKGLLVVICGSVYRYISLLLSASIP